MEEGIWVDTGEYTFLQGPNTPNMQRVICCFNNTITIKIKGIQTKEILKYFSNVLRKQCTFNVQNT